MYWVKRFSDRTSEAVGAQGTCIAIDPQKINVKVNYQIIPNKCVDGAHISLNKIAKTLDLSNDQVFTVAIKISKVQGQKSFCKKFLSKSFCKISSTIWIMDNRCAAVSLCLWEAVKVIAMFAY